MNGLETVASSSVVFQIGWTLLHSLWQGSVVAVVLVLVLGLIPMQRSNPRYAASCLALLAVCLLCVWTFTVVRPSDDVVVEHRLNLTHAASADSPRVENILDVPSEPIAVVQEANPPATVEATLEGNSTEAPPAPAESAVSNRWSGAAIPWLVAAWLVGATIVAIWHVGGYVLLRRLFRNSTAPTRSIITLVRDCAELLGVQRSIRVLNSKTVSSPAVVGILEPVILLPAALASGLSTGELKAILLHELAHIRRHDSLVNLIQALVESLLFYHPAVWWISYRIRAERENCCDDLASSALGNRYDYARALTAVSEQVSKTFATKRATLAADGGNLQHRIRRLLLPSRPIDTLRSRSAVGLLVIVAIVTTVLAVYSQANVEESQSAREREEVETHDSYGDPLPPGVKARIGTTRFRHGSFVHSMAFSQDGKKLVSSSYDATVRVWDVETGKQQFALPAERSQGTMFAISHDGKSLAVVDQGIELYDLATGKYIRKHDVGARYSNINAVAFFPDGERLATVYTGGTPDGGRVKIRSVATGDLLLNFDKHNHQLRSIAISPDGKTIASGPEFSKGRVLLWDAETGVVRHELKGHRADVSDIDFSPDGKRVACSSNGGYTIVWDVQSGKSLRTIKIGRHRGSGVCFTADGQRLVIATHRVATADTPGSVGLWDIDSGKQIRRYDGLPSGGLATAISPDGKRVAAGGWDGSIGMWDLETGKWLPGTTEPIGANHCLALSPRNEFLARGTFDGAVEIRRVDSGKLVHRFEVSPIWIWNASFSSDGRLLAVAGLDDSGSVATANVWNVRTGERIYQLEAGKGGISNVCFSPDDRLVAFVDYENKQVHLWNLESGNVVKSFPSADAFQLMFTSDGKRLVGMTRDNISHTWDLATGKMVASGQASNSNGSAVTSSADGRYFASSCNAGIVKFWQSGKRGTILQLNMKEREKDRLVGDDPKEGRERQSTHVLSNAIAFSRDQRYIVTSYNAAVDRSDGDTTQPQHICVWELASGNEVLRWRGHRGDVYGLAFSTNFDVLASASQDSTVLLWSLDPFYGKKRETSEGLSIATVKSLWRQLAETDAKQAYLAKWQLIHNPHAATRFLAEQLTPASIDVKKIRNLLKQLDDDSFEVRERATRQLGELGELALPLLRETLKKDPSLEAETRIQQMLDEHNPIVIRDKEVLRACRAVEVLERIGSPGARETLSTLAAGAPEAITTQHARSAMERIRSAGQP